MSDIKDRKRGQAYIRFHTPERKQEKNERRFNSVHSKLEGKGFVLDNHKIEIVDLGSKYLVNVKCLKNRREKTEHFIKSIIGRQFHFCYYCNQKEVEKLPKKKKSIFFGFGNADAFLMGKIKK